MIYKHAKFGTKVKVENGEGVKTEGVIVIEDDEKTRMNTKIYYPDGRFDYFSRVDLEKRLKQETYEKDSQG